MTDYELMSVAFPCHVPVPGPETACDLERLDNKLDTLQALWRQYGDCYRVPSESRQADTYVINHPDWVRRVLVTNHRNYTKGVGIDRVRVLLGNGIMASEGEHWRKQRRMLQSAFHKAKIEAFFDIYFQQARELAGRWHSSAQRGDAVNVSQAVSETTLLAVLQALFSEDLLPLQQEQGRNPFRIITEDSSRDLQFAMKFRALGKLIQQVADQRRQQRRFPPDLLSHCLLARDKSSGDAMTDKQLIDEVLTMIVAGHETTAASLNWVWYLLAMRPDAYGQIAQEAQSLAIDSVPDWSVLDSMVWIPRVLKEAMRLYPPGWLYTRRAVEPDCFGNYPIPAGADVFICSWLLHRHPDYWEKPEQFLPERFSPQQEAERHRYAYIPFSAGPRHCIGESFAMAEMMIHLAVVAARIRPQAPAALRMELMTDVNLRPREPLYLKLTPAG
jgi:cytochrome P450